MALHTRGLYKNVITRHTGEGDEKSDYKRHIICNSPLLKIVCIQNRCGFVVMGTCRFNSNLSRTKPFCAND